MRIPRAVFRCSSLLLLGLAAGNALALDPNKRITQYRHNTWRVQDGMLPDGPEWITQTADGYLLMGSRVMGVYQLFLDEIGDPVRCCVFRWALSRR